MHCDTFFYYMQYAFNLKLICIATGLAEQLTHSLSPTFVIQNVRSHRFAKPEVLVFIYFHHHAVNFCSL